MCNRFIVIMFVSLACLPGFCLSASEITAERQKPVQNTLLSAPEFIRHIPDKDSIDLYEFTYTFPSIEQHNGIKWMSFPVVDTVLSEGKTAYIFFQGIFHYDRLAEIIWKSNKKHDVNQIHSIFHSDMGIWFNQEVKINSLQGYKVRMNENSDRQSVIRHTGLLQSEDTPLNLKALDFNNQPVENWLGYFPLMTRSVFDAFGGAIDNLYFIQTQHWAMVRKHPSPGSPWLVSHPQAALSCGDMVVVKCFADTVFCWNTQETQSAQPPPYSPPLATRFSFKEEFNYLPIFISFEGIPLPKEVAVYANGVCFGASPVRNNPAQICAYLYGEIANYPELEFYLYYDELNKGTVPDYSIWQPSTQKYEKGKVQLDFRHDYILVGISSSKLEKEPLPQILPDEKANFKSPEKEITYFVPKDGKILIYICNHKDEPLRTLYFGDKKAGTYKITWDGKDDNGNPCATGPFLAKMQTNNKTTSKRFIKMK